MSLRLLTAGESHGPELVLIVEGLPAGVRIDGLDLDRHLLRRQAGYGRGARSTKVEHDHAEVVAGVAAGLTTGAPVAVRIRNLDFANQPESKPVLTTPRPGHADLAGAIKFGLTDLRLVRERASARETAARVAAAALVRPLLAHFKVEVGSFVTAIGGAETAVQLAGVSGPELLELAARAELDPVRCSDAEASQAMVDAIDAARRERQTLGGTFVVFASGVPTGLGSYTHWDRRLDGRLAGAICSIPAVKGVEVGPAFDVSRMPGVEAQDSILRSGASLSRGSNFAGGLEGGVTNGEPVVLRAAMKPLSSVRAELASIDLGTGQTADPAYIRSDVCAVPAAAVVAEAMVAWVLGEALLDRFGGDRLDAMLAAFATTAPPEWRT
ncbi:MAG: chorismate synthase [Candidatus Dormibacteria bacterium]